MKQQSNLHQISACPICDNQQLDTYLATKDFFYTQEEFSLTKCAKCDFVFTNPIPDLDKLSSYYETPDYLSHTVNKFSMKGFVYDQIRDINIRNKFKLVSKYKPKGSILDIGQGTGELLNFFSKKGWKTTGVEPNSSARKFAQEQYGLQVIDEHEIDQLGTGSFDVVSMWHVLEHVPGLNERMIQLKELLRQDGFVVIAVPMLDSPDSIHYQEYWAALDVPRHLYHFTSASLGNLLDKHGFNIIASYPMKFDAYYVSMLSEQYMKTWFSYLKATLNGLKSNMAAKKLGNYSSMIFVAEQK